VPSSRTHLRVDELVRSLVCELAVGAHVHGIRVAVLLVEIRDQVALEILPRVVREVQVLALPGIQPREEILQRTPAH
jgi:hypothetical protein